jgi:hypothetical protein
MKFILKNIEKIIFAIFLVCFIVIVMTTKTGLIKEVEPIRYPKMPKEFNVPKEEHLQFEKYDELIKKVRRPKTLSDYSSLGERNIFYKYQEPKPPQAPFVVKKIQAIPLGLIYQGVIELSRNRLIAQINFEGKTYFLKEGDVFADYEIKEITKDYCVVLDAKGKKIRLPYKRRVFSKEFEAQIYDPQSKNLLNVKRGFKIREYGILDIKATYVVLLDKNGNQIILKKGEE